MDTVSPFHRLTNQDAFDRMLSHLREQGQPAVSDSGSCRYRTSAGLKCAVGALIPDDSYRGYFEMEPLNKVLRLLGSDDVDQADFLRACQVQMHDNPADYYYENSPARFMEQVEKGARDIAERFGLIYREPAA